VDSSAKAALREAYLFSTDKPILHTLEFLHPSFVDGMGAPVAIRVVRDIENLTARLESTARLDAGNYVEFIAIAFEVTIYGSDSETVAPEISIEMDNVGRELMDHLEQIDTLDPVLCTYRAYLYDDLTQPQHDPITELEVTDIDLDIHTVKAKASIAKTLAGKSFPNRVSTTREFPTLQQ
jgi:hypothetical protein